ncbi:MAG: hypothetical protein JSW11_09680 [Candidatus Heimdallarchaeota archaeon]|nr:MAG: hypothetical protein JSW11_09680 [Candidatus Heimdallarchaeota archaeon]
MLTVKKWKGIKDITGNATKELIEIQEDGYLFYSAPEGHKLILLVVINEPPAWRMEIKDFGIVINGTKEGILRRGFSEGDNRMITDDDEPLLELLGNEKMGAEEIKKLIKEEWKKARLRVQGRE